MQLVSQPNLARGKRGGHDFIEGILRGHVFWVNIPEEHVEGTEQFHPDGPTPFVVVTRQAMHENMALVQGVPLSRVKKDDTRTNGPGRHFRIRIPTSELTYFDVHVDDRPLQDIDMLALTEQGRILAHTRLLGNPVARISQSALGAIEAGLRYVLDIPPAPSVAPT